MGRFITTAALITTTSALLVLQQSAYPLHAFQALPTTPRTGPLCLGNQYDTVQGRRTTTTHEITSLYALISPNEQDQDVKQGGTIDGLRRLFTAPRKNSLDRTPNLLDSDRRGGVLEPRDPIPYQIKYQSNTRVRTEDGGVTILRDGDDADNASNGPWGSIKDAIWDRVDGVKSSARSQEVRPPKPMDGYGDLFDPAQSTAVAPSQMTRATSQGSPQVQDQYSLGLTPGARIMLQQQQRAQEMKAQAADVVEPEETTELFNSIFSLPREEPQGPFASLKDSIYDRLDSFSQKRQDNTATKLKASPASKYNLKAGRKPLQNAEADTAQLEARREQEESSRKFETAKESLYDAADSIPVFAKAVTGSISDAASDVASTPEKVQQSVQNLQASLEETQRVASVVAEDVQNIPSNIKYKVQQVQDTVDEINQSRKASFENIQKMADQITSSIDKVEESSEELQASLGMQDVPQPPVPPPVRAVEDKPITERALSVTSTFAKAGAKLSFMLGAGAVQLGLDGAKWALRSAVDAKEERRLKEQERVAATPVTAVEITSTIGSTSSIEDRFPNLVSLESEVDEALRLAEEALNEVNAAVQDVSSIIEEKPLTESVPAPPEVFTTPMPPKIVKPVEPMYSSVQRERPEPVAPVKAPIQPKIAQEISYSNDASKSVTADKSSPFFASAIQDTTKTPEKAVFKAKESTRSSNSLQKKKPTTARGGVSVNDAFKAVQQSSTPPPRFNAQEQATTNPIETPVIMDGMPAYGDVVPKEHFVTMLKRPTPDRKEDVVAAELSKATSRSLTLKRKKSWFRRLFSGIISKAKTKTSSNTTTTSSKEEQRQELKRQAAMTRNGSPSYVAVNNKRRFSLRNLLRGRKEKKAPVRPRRRFSSMDDSVELARSSADEASQAADEVEQTLRR